MKRKLNITSIIIIIVLLVILTVIIIVTGKSSRELTSNLEDAASAQKEAKASNVVTVFCENEEKFEDYDILISPSEFYENYENIDYNSSKKASLRLSLSEKIDSDEDDLLLLYFVAYVDGVSAQIKISVGTGYTITYTVTPDKCAYYIPMTGIESAKTIRIDIISGVTEMTLGDFYLVNYHDKDVTDVKTGVFNLSDYDEETISLDLSISDDGARNMDSDGEYIYTVKSGTLTIYGAESGYAYGTLTDLGNTRDVAVIEGKDAVIVTAREYGVYFIDVSDKENPRVISTYDAGDMPMCVTVSGTYAFFTDQNNGVEIVDFSDMENPEYVSTIADGNEAVTCFVSGSYLFVSSWTGMEVNIYNISNVADPELVSTVEADGYVFDVFVDGDYLYLSNSLYSISGIWHEGAYGCGYGSGNGVEIYDISDIESPEWVSNVRIDGRYFSQAATDDFDIYVSDGILYFSQSENGLYVYDVSDPYRPTRLAHYTFEAGEDEDRSGYDNDAYIYPYKSETEYNEAITDFVCVDGAIYASGYQTGIFRVERDECVYESAAQENDSLSVDFDAVEEINVKLAGYDVTTYECDGVVYAVREYEDRYYLACGYGGIEIIDEDLNLISRTETDGAVKDIRVTDGYVYAAEGSEGVVIYEIYGDSLVPVGSFVTEETAACSSIEVSSDGRFVLAQFSSTDMRLIDAQTKTAPVEVSGIELPVNGTMSYRNICDGLVDDRYIGYFTSQEIVWLDTQANNSEGIEIYSQSDNPYYTFSMGLAAYEEYAIILAGENYIFLTPDSASSDDFVVYTISDETVTGKISAVDDVLMVSNASNASFELITLKTVEELVLSKSVSLNDSPYTMVKSDDIILIPCGHAGLVVLTDR